LNNFLVRAITGALFVIVMVGCIWWCFWSFAVLFGLITIFSLWEFYSLLEKSGEKPQKVTGVIIGILFYGSVAYVNHQTGIYGTLIAFSSLTPIIGIVFFIELFRKRKQPDDRPIDAGVTNAVGYPHPFRNAGFTILGISYIVFPFTLMNAVMFRSNPEDVFLGIVYTPYMLLGFFFLVWSNDTFAYLTGRAFGSTKLFERVSPKKTWEGTIGGVIVTQGVAVLLAYVSAKNNYTDITLIHWMVIGGIISVTATLGDLAESLFKRSINIKDSGGILPGHGGLLDRFDGVLLSFPFMLLYIILMRVFNG
jgi:phosphatidate cytidylyltransferase